MTVRMEDVRNRIAALADEKYRAFSASLIPTNTNVLGVRLPQLRKLAKELMQGDWRPYVEAGGELYFEEAMLKGMMIGYARTDAEDRLRLIAGFVPKIDNWSVCDSFCTGLKFTIANREQIWSFLQPYLASNKEYEIRFGVVMLLNYYIEESYIDDVLDQLDRINHPAYYVKMAVAWAVSICYVKLPERTMAYLTNSPLDVFTYNKSLQKITESNRVSAEAKAIVRAMKRKA